MGAKKISLTDVAVEGGGSGLAALMTSPDAHIRRDVMMLLNPEETDSGNLQVGYTTVYPECSTRGHNHDHLEEVYFFTHGKGIIGLPVLWAGVAALGALAVAEFMRLRKH